MSRRWTMRLAHMLAIELATLEAESCLVGLDGGVGALALAAILAVPEGPQRDFEIAAWAKRIASRAPRTIAHVIRPDGTDAEIDALVKLHEALIREWRAA